MKKRYTVNFARHLADCEFNYRKLCLLMPGWRENGLSDTDNREWRYLTGGQNVMLVQVIESAKFTTTVHISVDSPLQKQLRWFKPKTGLPSNKIRKLPLTTRQDAAFTLDVRLYHDADLAEVITFANQRRFLPRHEYPNNKMYQQDEKSQLNLFLGEILDNCLESGRVEQAFAFITT